MITAFNLITQMTAHADAFGAGTNTFALDFVNIGNAGNAADTTGYGAVPYEYRIGKYEISQDAIEKATASGMANVTAGAWSGNQPAANISWFEVAAFVNWLNTSTGKTAAYDLSWDGSAWSMALWSSEQAWTAGGTNLYRHKDAYYFLPSENEWYKAAYYDPLGVNYYKFPTGSDVAPSPVINGTIADTAIYNGLRSSPAGIDVAGGLSVYGTMAQGGNVYEWIETEFDGINNDAEAWRTLRGGNWGEDEGSLRSSYRLVDLPLSEDVADFGFRVASVPEPSTYALLAMSAAGALWWARRRK
jgi:formylglycine-generating enzyme required for sulfatase activity